MQIPMFLAIFMAPVFVPLRLVPGWLHDVARFNPVTYIMQANRDLIAGVPSSTTTAILAIAGLFLAMLVWALTGVRSAERAGG
jgi:ABC-2 type transport system permease protein